MRSVTVVGICGASGSGKSTLSTYLAEQLASPVLSIRADDYFKKKNEKPKCCLGLSDRRCNEMAESVDMHACALDVQAVVETLRNAATVPSITLKRCLDREEHVNKPLSADTVTLFVEGFVLFAEPAIVQLCEHLLWLDCDQETCCSRRFARRSARCIELQKFESFYSHVYQHHLDIRPRLQEAMSGRSSIFVDGRKSFEQVQLMALRDLQVALAAPMPMSMAKASTPHLGHQPVQQQVETKVPVAMTTTAVSEEEPSHKAPQKPKQRRWGRSGDDPSRAKEVGQSAPPDELESHTRLIGQRVRVQWVSGQEKELTIGLLRQAQGRRSIKVLTDEDDIVLIPVGAVYCLAPDDQGALEASRIAHAPQPSAEKSAWKRRRSKTSPFVFDMETSDPDDVLTLLFLCANPSVELRAVTITPGSEEQVSLVRWILNEVGLRGVRLGVRNWPVQASQSACPRGRFYDCFGRLEQGASCEPADRLLREVCDEHVTLVTGAALHNLGAALELDGFQLGRWIAQGGFAGEGVVPRHLQMKKFEGMVACQTYNFNGNIKAATSALASPCIQHRVLVSKNVCHRAVYDEPWHSALGAALATEEAAHGGSGTRAASLRMIHDSMGAYLRRGGEKKLHDPLALAVALDESVCTLAEVQVFHGKGGWGSRLAAGSGTWISIDYDPAKFQAALLDAAQGLAK